MESKNYYEILGVSRNATLKEIVAAKNKLAKKYHPDSNVQYNIDTTEQMQVILEAYRVLSDTKKRTKYDRKLKGIQKEMQTFDLNKSNESSETDSLFVQCWRACGELYDLLEQSKALYKDKTKKNPDKSLELLDLLCTKTKLNNTSIKEETNKLLTMKIELLKNKKFKEAKSIDKKLNKLKINKVKLDKNSIKDTLNIKKYTPSIGFKV